MMARIRKAVTALKAELQAVKLLKFLGSAALVVIVNKWLGI